MTVSRQYSVLADGLEIGTTQLSLWDDGMAVVGGGFLPNEEYESNKHATELDGVKLHGFDFLTLVDPTGAALECAAVSLVDWSSEAGSDGFEVTAFGVYVTEWEG